MASIDEAKHILDALGRPPAQRNRMSAVTLLALYGLTPDQPWAGGRRSRLTGTKSIIEARPLGAIARSRPAPAAARPLRDMPCRRAGDSLELFCTRCVNHRVCESDGRDHGEEMLADRWQAGWRRPSGWIRPTRRKDSRAGKNQRRWPGRVMLRRRALSRMCRRSAGPRRRRRLRRAPAVATGCGRNGGTAGATVVRGKR